MISHVKNTLKEHSESFFLHWHGTGDKICIQYGNPKCLKTICETWPTSQINGKAEYATVLPCIWWDQKGGLYYYFLKSGKTIYGERYRYQLDAIISWNVCPQLNTIHIRPQFTGIQNWLHSFWAAATYLERYPQVLYLIFFIFYLLSYILYLIS